jgi:protoporphyrinogen oxidase
MPSDVDVLVIGAGPAGLTAAYQLTKEHKNVVVIEQDPHQVGGISRTVNYKNYLFDIGGHRFFSKSKEVVALWNEILPEDFIERPRLSRIFYNDRFYSYPLNGIEALKNLGIIESARCMLSYFYAKLTPIEKPISFHQWVRNEFGERLFSIFFKTYTEKVWGMSCDEISADWASQRIKGLSLGTAVWNALTRMWRGAKKQSDNSACIKTLIESFRYPRKGPGQLWDSCATKIKAQGGSIMMGRKLSSLTWYEDAGVWCVEAVNASGEIERYKAKHVISSAPIKELMAALNPSPISRLHARDLRYRDFLTVALIARTHSYFPDNWVYIHDPSVMVGRVQNFRSWSPHLVPDDDMTCLGLEYFCFEGDGLWTSSDEELVALATKEISKIGLLRAEDVVDACVVRQPKAYPVYDDNYRWNVEMVRRDLKLHYPHLHLVGRNGMHKYNNQDHAMMTAMLTVRNILAGKDLYDVWAVNEDAEYHEAGSTDELEALGSVRMVPQRRQAYS